MRFKNFREAHKSSHFSEASEREKKIGKDYNWILANHFSLAKYMKENRISYEDAFRKYVVCDVFIMHDEDNIHRQKAVSTNLRRSLMFEDTLYYGEYHKSLKFVDGDRTIVPLLYLLCNAFSIQKSRLFDTRIEETRDSGRSANSAKRVNRGESPLALDMVDIINAEFQCTANVFLEPVLYADGEDVDWYIEYSSIEENRKMALKLYNNTFDFLRKKPVEVEEFYEIQGKKKSKKELKLELKRKLQENGV